MIKSFGCSFVFGCDLDDCFPEPLPVYSDLTWPALVAEHKKTNYHCYARPGRGNLFILNSILEQPPSSDDIFLINWTWIDRYDYVDVQTEKWGSLRPAESSKLEKFYYRNLHSQYKDMLTNLGYIKLALDYLLDNQIKFIMTYMDYLLLEQPDPDWHHPGPVTYLQNKIRPYLANFDGKNFLDWAKSNNYPISKDLHPLKEAHLAASQYMIKQHLI